MSGEGMITNRNTVTTRMRRGTIVCPVCNGDAGIRDSDQETELVKWLWCMCLNTDCGMTWKAQISFVHVLSPSAIELPPGLHLPPAPPGYQRRIFPAGPPVLNDPNQASIFDVLDPDAPASARAA